MVILTTRRHDDIARRQFSIEINESRADFLNSIVKLFFP